MNELNGLHVLISGAGGALGTCLAVRARELGARLTLIDRVVPARTDGDSWIEVDLCDALEAQRALAELPPCDALFHVAGGFAMGKRVHESGAAEMEAMLSINLVTLHNIVRAVVPRMIARGKGAIVTVGALGALKGGAGMAPYAIAKSAVMRLTESLSAELRDHGINVNCVLPSIIDTPANRRDMPDADFDRWVSPRELAEMICFLGSPLASAMHGALVPVAGRV